MTMTNTMKALFKNIEVDDLLDVIGLERKRSTSGLAAIGLVTFGAAVGAGIALLFAPQTGSQTRQYLSEQLPKVNEMMPKVNEVVEKVKTSIGSLGQDAINTSDVTRTGGRNITS